MIPEASAYLADGVPVVDEFGQWMPDDWPGKAKASFRRFFDVHSGKEPPFSRETAVWSVIK